MADQDFNIKVVTTADTSGLKATSAELDQIKKKAEAASAANAKQSEEAAEKWARSPLNPANSGGAPVAGGGVAGTGGTAGTAVGVGTIVALLTGAINKWKEFIEEENKIIERMEAAREAMRLEALEIAKIKDLDFSKELIDSAHSAGELEANIGRVSHQIAVLHGEQDALDPLTQSKEWNALRAAIQSYGGQLDTARSKLRQLNQETLSGLKDKAEELKNAIGSASPQVRAELMNEQAARKAREEGRGKDADMFQKSADDFKRSMTEVQKAELEAIRAIKTEDKDSKTAKEIQSLKAYMQSIWGG